MVQSEEAQSMDVETAVLDRYSRGAEAREDSLCCPVDYRREYLDAIPQEVLEKDYGCGDPTAHAREGEDVLDLGCGAGKLCYIAAQVVGPRGSVIGVDFNANMLAVARKYRGEVARRLGYENVDFRRGRIQDLALDLEAMDLKLREEPVGGLDDWERFRAFEADLRARRPLVAGESVDLVMSNCVLNLVREQDRAMLFSEMHRVLRRGGRAVISDIVSDEPVPAELREDPDLWSGCIAGAFQEEAFLDAFAAAGFYGMEIVKREATPWRTVNGIEFRSATVVAYKGKEGPCLDYNQAVLYRGPWQRVVDDDGHALDRGVPTAVCDKTFKIYTTDPYASHIIPVPPRTAVGSTEATPFDCARDRRRDPRETKGDGYRVTTEPAGTCCAPRDESEPCC